MAHKKKKWKKPRQSQTGLPLKCTRGMKCRDCGLVREVETSERRSARGPRCLGCGGIMDPAPTKLSARKIRQLRRAGDARLHEDDERCPACGQFVQMPHDPLGQTCPRCGEPLLAAFN